MDKLNTTPAKIEAFRRVRAGILELSGSELLDFDLEDSFDKDRAKTLQKVVAIGKNKEINEYGRYKKDDWFYHYILGQKKTFNIRSFIRDLNGIRRSLRFLSLSGYNAYKIFKISDEYPDLLHNVPVDNEDNLLQIDNTEIALSFEIDAIEKETAFVFESTITEPSFFDFIDRVDWKMYGLVFPELKSVKFQIFHYAKDKPNFKQIMVHEFEMVLNEGTNAEAIAEIRAYKNWLSRHNQEEEIVLDYATAKYPVSELRVVF